MACRLALRLGVENPYDLLERIEPDVMLLWRAFYRLEPFGDEYLRDAMIAREVASVRSFIAAGSGVEVRVPPIRAYMPPGYTTGVRRGASRRQRSRESIAKAKGAFAAMFGGGGKR